MPTNKMYWEEEQQWWLTDEDEWIWDNVNEKNFLFKK